LVQRDAVTFARVMTAIRTNNRQAFQRTLRSATDVPCRIVEHAQTIRAICRKAAHAIRPQFHSDLTCAKALAAAAEQGARALINTNLVWMNHQAYTRAIRRRLRATERRR